MLLSRRGIHPKAMFITSVLAVASISPSHAQTAVARKGVTLAGDLSQFTANNYAMLQ